MKSELERTAFVGLVQPKITDSFLIFATSVWDESCEKNVKIIQATIEFYFVVSLNTYFIFKIDFCCEVLVQIKK